MTKEIIFVLAPICPKCVRIKRWLRELEKTSPEIKISRYNIATQYKEVKKFKIKTIPTLIIGETMLGGWIKEEEFRAALEKL
jgi:glutaredoxin